MEVYHNERCRGPKTLWCILTIYAHLVLFLSTSMIVPLFEICNPTSVSVLQQSAAIIANWSIDNGMRITTMKTKENSIRFCRDPVFLPYINIDGAAIERVPQVKVLGVTLSSDLSWNSHVDGIVSKARKRVFLIYQLKRAGIGQCDLVRIYIYISYQASYCS